MASIAAVEAELAAAKGRVAETVDAEGKELSKSERKKRLKMVQKYEKALVKAKAKAEKAAAAAAAGGGGAGGKKKAAAGDTDPVEPWKYFENRSKMFAEMEQKFEDGGRQDELSNPYPHKFHVDMSIPNYRQKFDSIIKDGEHDATTSVSIAGRVTTIRGAGKLVFFVLQGDGAQVQIMSSERDYLEGT